MTRVHEQLPPPPPPAGLSDLPEIPDPRTVSKLDARSLSAVLFDRLRDLEEGTIEYSYVRNTLVELNGALVRFAARRFRSRSEPVEDVVQVGMIGLIKAIDRFDPDRGVEFASFAMPTIVGEIKRFFRDTSWSVQVPRRLQELRLDLLRATDELEQAHGREPTVAELAERLGRTEAEIVEGQQAANAYTSGTLDSAADSEEVEGPLARRLGYDEPALDYIECAESLKPLIAELPERSRTILSLRFVEELTQAQIGERLGISQMHVSRLLARSLTALRAQLLAED